jgi:glutathione synthase
MSKPTVARKYLTEAEAQRILGSLVATWEFDSLSEEQSRAVAEMYRRNPESYVLKPNGEGGCNNFFGEAGARLLCSLSFQQRKQYVLQEIIPPIYEENEIMVGLNRVVRTSCKYELGRYGVISEVQGQLRRNETHGYLVKSHARGFNEVSITKGTASVVAWKYD